MSESLPPFFTDEEVDVNDVQDFDARSWRTDDDQDFDTQSWGTGDDSGPLLLADYTGTAHEETFTPADQATAPTQQSITEVRERWQAYYADLDRRATRVQRPTLNRCKYPFKHPYHSTEGVIPNANLITYVDKGMGRAGISCSKNPCSDLTYADLRPGSFITMSSHIGDGTVRTPDSVPRAFFSKQDATSDGKRAYSGRLEMIVLHVMKDSMVAIPVFHQKRPAVPPHATGEDDADPNADGITHPSHDPNDNCVVPGCNPVRLYESDFPLFPNSCTHLFMHKVLFSQDIRLYGQLSADGMTILRAAWLRNFGRTIEEEARLRTREGWRKRFKSSRLGRKLTLGKSKGRSS